MAARIGYEDPSTGQSGELRLSSSPYYDAALGNFAPRISESSDPEISIEVSMPQWRRRAQTSYSTIEIINADGAYDFLKNLIFEGHPARVAFLNAARPWDEQLYGWSAVVSNLMYRGSTVVQIVLRSEAESLRRPVHGETFSDSVPAEQLRGQPVPLVIGRPVQCPCLLYDEVGAAEVRWFVAANASSMVLVAEGGLSITQGQAAGQFEPAEGGFTLNQNASLPITADPVGPYRSHFPIPELRFLVWDELDGYEVPRGWIYEDNDPGGSQWIRRHADTHSAEIRVNGLPWLRMQRSGLQPGRQYRVRAEFGTIAGGADEITLVVLTRTSQGVEKQIINQVVDVTVGFETTFTPDPAHTTLVLLWFDVSATTVRLTRLEIEEEHPDSAAQSIDDVVPELTLRMADQPIAADQIDWDALTALGAQTSGLKLGRYCQGTETVEQLLDECVQSVFAGWWFDDRLRVGRLAVPEGAASVLQIADHNRLTDIEVELDTPPLLSQSVQLTRNWQPIPADRAAASLSSTLQARNATEFRKTLNAAESVMIALHPYYRAVLSAEPLQTILAETDGAQTPYLTALLGLYDQLRYWWRVSVALPGLSSDVWSALKPLTAVTLTDERFEAHEKKLRVIGLKLRPQSRRADLLLWG
jgi:hypothetical protein